ncbi:hypothetical protein EJB05_21011 [Eragrostis curvula]|uniref:ZZ-type domain-containing protein n=1 Tax=Eragrostis curvula TaxID=38414 RepID=A0A5J9V0L1_9POAL|nr:hypothetical protein EJB05_21011 [Eragrostis curvula]
MSHFGAPVDYSKAFAGSWRQPEAWDVTFKVKYGDTLKRFYGSVNGTNLDINLSALRAKIVNAFKFGPDAEFILTYTDEDGDAVMLDDDDDLRDAALHQKLNPLRINVQLKTSHPNEGQKSNSESVKPPAQDPISQIMSAIEALKPLSRSSTAQEECLAQIKSAVGEAIKSVPEPIPDVLAKLSHEVLDSAPPPFAELIKPLVQLITPNNNSDGSSEGHADGSSSTSSGVTQTPTQMPAKANDTNLVSRPLNVQKSESPEESGLRSMLDEAAAAPASAGASQGQQTSLYPSVEELLFPSYLIDKSYKGKSDAHSKGKSVMSSTTQPAPPAVPNVALPPPPSISEWFQPRRCHSHRYEGNAKDKTDSRWRVPIAPFGSLPHAPPGYGSSPHFPYPSRLLSSGRVYGDLKMENSAARSLHKWIQCDGCGVQPIVGPRYKSNVREDYDLCDSCFQRMGNEVEYTKIDKPVAPHRLSRDPNVYRKLQPRVLMKSKREKLESRFILDVTVLDGTLMAPSTQFTKIWRMHNNGSIMWPLGTQLIWVGGDQFALQTSVPLEVEDPSFVNAKNKNAAINLNLPPESNGSNTVNLIDVNMEPVTSTQGYHPYPVDMSFDVFEPNTSQPAPFTFVVPSVSSTDPVANVPSSGPTTTSFAPSVSVPKPEPVVPAVPSPVSVPNMPATTPVPNTPVSVPNMPAFTPAPNTPVSVPNITATTPVAASASAPAPVDAVVPEPFAIDGDTEEKLLRELEEMGFRQVDLNKEILRQNKYNLEQSVDDLCGVNEWDPLLAELEEMGFDDTEMNKELLAKNGGSIKRAVMDLVAREKKDK